MSFWQVAAGSEGRNYARYFLKYGMAFVGGDANMHAMNQVQLGDVIVLKRGLSELLAAGVVVERDGAFKGRADKEWLYDFDGWGLEGYCFVDWHVPPNGYVIYTEGLTRTTIQGLPKVRHQDIANVLIASTPASTYDKEPEIQPSVSDEELLNFLIAQGLRPSAADDIAETLRKIRLLANYYFHKCDWHEIREHETRTFLVIPFLLALGWSEQQLKIELPCSKGKIDVACFGRAHRSGSTDCVLIVETKDFASGLDYAPEQGHGYAGDFQVCRVVVVTNGYCYKSYLKRDNDAFSLQPDAYLNLLDPRSRYPLDPVAVDGALALLKWLLPSQLR